MNILMLMLSDSSGVGGMEKHARELSCELAGLGHSVTLAAASQHLSGIEPTVKTQALDTGGSRNSPFLLLTVLRLIRASGFDVVHAQGTKAAFVLQRLAPFTKGRMRVATIHGFKSRYPRADTFHQLIAVSQALATDIAQPGVTVIYNGVSVIPQAPALLPAETERPVWLAVGRLVPVKGFEFLIKAFQHCPGTLLIAGDGPERQRLADLISSTCQSGTVKLLGFRTDVPALMAAADGVVISSEREGFSYVCAEALLLGKPVISTDVPIANEVLPEKHIFHGEDPKRFAALLRQDTSSLASEQTEARTFAADKLSLKTMARQTLNVYQKAIAERP
ncbi:glycosyltransferase [Marinobacter sp.]|uniref:glycosyltransferase n=1 Tax=Marinobacter sp. TaxID=50741 RepID=UPI001A0570B6|nr:glycosyltransferase [Marinobacter sp.]MBE0487078.1 glycosyltransferase [Marinobacter sp.]